MFNWINKLKELKDQNVPFAIVTIVQCKGSTPREVGAKMLVLRSGEFFGSVGGGNLEHTLIAEASAALEEGQPRFVTAPLCSRLGQCCGGSVDAFIEVSGAPAQLYVFGAGHVGQAVARTLEGTPIEVTLIDEREEWISHPGLPEGVKTSRNWREFAENAKWDARNTYAVIMTHDHDLDREILKLLIAKPTRYLGLIGSDTKWRTFKHKLELELSQEQQALLEKVHCPIGLPLGGGKEPQTIAISLAAELLKLHYV